MLENWDHFSVSCQELKLDESMLFHIFRKEGIIDVVQRYGSSEDKRRVVLKADFSLD